MAIMLRCPKCQSQSKLGTRTCAKCGHSLKRSALFKGIVKMHNGKFRTRLVDTFKEAARIEQEFIEQKREAEAVKPDTSLNQAGQLFVYFPSAPSGQQWQLLYVTLPECGLAPVFIVAGSVEAQPVVVPAPPLAPSDPSRG